MKFLVFTLFLASQVYAANNCAKYENYPRYKKAIEVVAANEGMSYEELCNLPRVWDVEAQPTHIFTREGERIPHVRVQLHMEYSSCLYMVRDADLVITKNYCYSGT